MQVPFRPCRPITFAVNYQLFQTHVKLASTKVRASQKACSLFLLFRQCRFHQKYVEISDVQCYIIRERVPIPKWTLPNKVIWSKTTASLVGQTGGAFLFFLTFSFIKKGKKRYNQTTKGTEQSQYTDENRNNFESCHNNAPPFLCIPASWLKAREATTLSWVLFHVLPRNIIITA